MKVFIGSLTEVYEIMKSPNLVGLLIFVGYAAIFLCTLFGFLAHEQRKRRTRRPFGENVRLMRMPGERLWRRVIEKDQSEMPWAIGLMVVPVILAGIVLQLVNHFYGNSACGFIIALVVLAFLMVGCVRLLQKRWQERWNEYLGFFGERFVAECLEPLKSQGWFIFHDIQCDGATGKFNLDHVAIGPGGVWVVETKTRRQGRARPGFRKDQIIFDGAKIIWPWWDDTASIKQAANNANWLQEWLQTMTGKKFDVSAVLAFPGFSVEEKKKTGVRLANPRDLRDVLTGHGRVFLNSDEIDLIRRQLEAQCRDVEY